MVKKCARVFLEAQRQRLYLTQILYAGGSEESKRREKEDQQGDILVHKRREKLKK